MLRFDPQYELVPWGGRRLEEEFGRTLPEGPVGESWELCDLGERQSRVREGSLTGRPLGELWRDGALDGSARGPFPFLLKWLNTEERLSVQVHPDEATCTTLADGHPKTEAWCVVQTEPGAAILLGHYPGLDAATLRQAATGGTIQKWLYETSPRVGDMYLVPAGTLHALGGGLVLLEVQQPSDTTYRVYDWDRVGLDGSPRTLHMEQACAAVDFDRFGPPQAQRHEIVGPCYVMRLLRTGVELPPGHLRVLVAHAGDVTVKTEQGEESLSYGDVVVAEPKDGRLRIQAGTCLLLTEPSEEAEPTPED